MTNTNSDSLKQALINKGSELSDKIAKDSGYKGEGSGKSIAKDLYKVGVLSKETKVAVINGVDKRNDLAHPYGKQKTDVSTNISESDVTDFSNAVDEIDELLKGDIDISF